MDRQIFTTEQVNQLLQAQDTVSKARIADGSFSHPFNIQSMVIDLTTAKLSTAPLKIGFAFKSIWVATATDTAVNVSIKPGAQDSFQSTVPLKKNDALSFPYPISEAYLEWTAQSGKSITLIFFLDGEFHPGSQISVQSGGVTVSEGSALAAGVAVTLVATTAALIVPANAVRNVCIIQNKTGADLYIGDATVTNAGATEGIKIPSDGLIEWKNTAGLFGYSVAGGKVSSLECS